MVEPRLKATTTKRNSTIAVTAMTRDERRRLSAMVKRCWNIANQGASKQENNKEQTVQRQICCFALVHRQGRKRKVDSNLRQQFAQIRERMLRIAHPAWQFGLLRFGWCFGCLLLTNGTREVLRLCREFNRLADSFSFRNMLRSVFLSTMQRLAHPMPWRALAPVRPLSVYSGVYAENDQGAEQKAQQSAEQAAKEQQKPEPSPQEKEIAELKDKAKEFQDKWVRSLAELVRTTHRFGFVFMLTLRRKTCVRSPSAILPSLVSMQ